MDRPEFKHSFYPAARRAEAVTMVLLHGEHGDEAELSSVISAFANQVNVITIQGNLVTSDSNAEFFGVDFWGSPREKQVREQTDALTHVIRELATEEKLQLNTLVGIGYSNGAIMVTSILLQHPTFLAAAILFRPSRPYALGRDVAISVPVLICAGRRDRIVAPEVSTELAKHLSALGATVELRMLEAGHQLSDDDGFQAMHWFENNLSPHYANNIRK